MAKARASTTTRGPRSPDTRAVLGRRQDTSMPDAPQPKPTLGGALLNISVDPMLGRPGTEIYQGLIAHEPTTALQDFAGHGYTGYSPGQFELLQFSDPDVEMFLTLISTVVADGERTFEGGDAVQRAWIEDNLSKWVEPTWEEFVRNCMVGMSVHGWATYETVMGMRNDERAPGGRGYYVADIAERLQRSVVRGWNVDDKARLISVRQRPIGGIGNMDYVDIPAERILQFTRRRTGANYEGQSALRVCWYAMQIRQMLLRLLGVDHDRTTLGIPVVSVETGADIKKLNQVLKDAEDLRSHSRAAMYLPPGYKLEWIFHGPGAASRKNIMDSYERLGQIVRRNWLVNFLGLGENGVGARSLGETMLHVFSAALRGMVNQVTSVINGVANRSYTGLIKRVIDLNWGEQKEYPTLKISIDIGQVAQTFNAILQGGVKSGLLTYDLELENAVRKQAGLPPRKDPDTITQDVTDPDKASQAGPGPTAAVPSGAQPPPTAPGFQPPFGNEKKPGGGPDQRIEPAPKSQANNEEPGSLNPPVNEGQRLPPTSKKPPKIPAAMAERSRGNRFASWRDLRPEEQHVAWSEIAGALTDGPTQLSSMLKKAVDGIAKSSAARYKRIVTQQDSAALKKLPLLNRKPIAAAVKQYLATMRTKGAQQVRAEHDAQRVDAKQVLAQRRAGKSTALVEEDAKPRTGAYKPEEVVDAMAEDLADNIEARIQSAATTTATQQLMRGAWDEDAFFDALDSAVSNGLTARDASQVTMQAFNLGREEAAEQYGDEIQGVERSALLDNDACDTCADKDGQTADFDSAEHDDLMCPDPGCDSVASGTNRCRCILVYLFGDKAEDGDEEEDAADAA